MKVTTVSASVRYSRPLGDGSFKTIELGAEATLTGQDIWVDAQASLYQELGQQLKALWTNRKNVAAPQESKPAPQQAAHYCQQHQTPFKMYEKEGRTWYAHKVGSEWCREKS